MKVPKIAHLSSAHTATDTRIFLKECTTLAKAKHDVIFIVPHHQDEQKGEVQIKAVPKASGRRGRMTKTVWNVLRAAIREKADLYHFHDPELIPVGLILKLIGKKVIYDVHEDLPRQIRSKHWIPRWIRWAVGACAEAVEAIGAVCFDGIIAATPVIARRFPKKKTAVVQNFPLAHELSHAGFVPHHERPNKIAYIGGISIIRGVQEMIEALELLPDSLDVRLVLAGDFSPAGLEEKLRALPGWKRVEFVGWQTREGVKELLATARAGMVTFHPVPNHIEAQPNKLFEYMSAGLAVIASDFPLWRKIVGERRCGLLVDPLDREAIAQAIQQLIEHPDLSEAMGKSGERAVRDCYHWDAEAPALLNMYDTLLHGTGKGEKWHEPVEENGS